MLKDDLKAAKIEYETDDEVADFRALRHVFGTLLGKARAVGKLPGLSGKVGQVKAGTR